MHPGIGSDSGGAGGADGRPHVVIVGGGFGGLHAARALRREPVRITLLDRSNHHLFLPLLYQVATAGLNPGDIARPIRRILRKQRNATVLLAEAVGIDRAARQVRLAHGEAIGYDFLVLACGTTTSWFGRDDWRDHAPGLHDLADALECRRRLILAWEAAERENDPGRRRRLLTFVVVGGGPTGVEMAGAIAEMSRLAMAREYRRVDPGTSRVILIEGGDRILPAFPPALSTRARRALERIGVEVRTGVRVDRVDAHGVTAGEARIEAGTVLWAAGVAAAPVAAAIEAPRTPAGQVMVRPDLSMPGHPECFVIGDAACVRQDGGVVPGLAPAAIQMGRHAAANIAATIRGRARRDFRYRDRGTLATIGRSAAVADFGAIRLWGWPAWIAWLSIHIVALIGFRNRALVMFQWAWAWWTYERGPRLVTEAAPAGAADRPGPGEVSGGGGNRRG